MPANAMDLITIARAKQNLPSITDSSQDTNLQTLVTAVSKAIQRYCRRDFVQCVYDELYNGTGAGRLFLRQYPVQSVQAVRHRPTTVLKITNTTGSTNQQARVSVTSTGLTLTRVASGVSSSDSSVTFAGNVTLNAVATAVNALGNGWSAQVVGDYALWPSADLWCLNGNKTDTELNAMAGQGALNAANNTYAELKMHTYELSGYQIDQRRGWVLRAIPYTDPELLHPEDLIWPEGVNNFRIQYTAGYGTIPEDVQEACTELVVSFFKSFDQNQLFVRESIPGQSHTWVFDFDPLGKGLGCTSWPHNVRALLAPYRRHQASTGQS